MKLIFCPRCNDVRKLGYRKTTCQCGASTGWYKPDGLQAIGLQAIIVGAAIPLGIDNSSLASAIKNRPLKGKGKLFDAFVIPSRCPTIEQVDPDRFCASPRASSHITCMPWSECHGNTFWCRSCKHKIDWEYLNEEVWEEEEEERTICIDCETWRPCTHEADDAPARYADIENCHSCDDIWFYCKGTCDWIGQHMANQLSSEWTRQDQEQASRRHNPNPCGGSHG